MIYATQSGQKPKTGVQYMYVAKSGVLSVQFIISLNVYPI